MKNEINIRLTYSFHFKWRHYNGISILTNGNADEYFARFVSVKSIEEVKEILSSIDSNFAIIIQKEYFVFAAVDRMRSFPLFYKNGPNWVLTDSIAEVENEFELDAESVDHFKEIFCTIGNNTLIKNWYQLQGGEFLWMDKQSGKCYTETYYSFQPKAPSRHLEGGILRNIFLITFQKLIDEIGHRPIIVPLSGGYDSRLILAVLKELNVRNVFSYTYGKKDSPEKNVAQKVATTLGYDWHFIEYSDELLARFFSEEWKTFFMKNHHFTSLPNEQDYFALSYLKEHELLPKNGVVLSGYLGDYYAGNSIFFEYAAPDKESQMEFLYLNRGSKFIINSVRLYEYFGLEWRLPFADASIMDYLFHVPLVERQGQNGYIDFLFKYFFEPLQIDYRKSETQPFFGLKKIAKSILPNRIIKSIQHQNSLKPELDINNTNFLRKRLFALLKNNAANMPMPEFNELFSEYLIQSIKDQYKM